MSAPLVHKCVARFKKKTVRASFPQNDSTSNAVPSCIPRETMYKVKENFPTALTQILMSLSGLCCILS
jgi:hypothetical protein